MPRFTLSTLVAVAVISSGVYAQNSTGLPSSTPPAPSIIPTSPPTGPTSAFTPLASKHFDYNNLPFKADTDTQTDPNVVFRGPQSGYNRCNSTTENQESMCQTFIVNGPGDFCIWAPPTGPKTIGESEHEVVSWCTKPGHGTRLIPDRALTGVQYIKTPDYVQIVGFIDQTQINIPADDYGGELDPHGADLRGNPLGGLVYTKIWSSDYKQVIEWTNFMGGNGFCLKVCDPAGPNAAKFCEHKLDRIGCAYNAPNNAKNGTFESCQGDNMDIPGIYTDANGQVQTYAQPPESLGPISTMPYQPKVPASSNCETYTSSLLYTGLPTASIPPASSGLSSVRSTGTGTRSSSGTGPANTGSSSGANGSSGSPTGLAISSLTCLLGVALAAFFLS